MRLGSRVRGQPGGRAHGRTLGRVAGQTRRTSTSRASSRPSQAATSPPAGPSSRRAGPIRTRDCCSASTSSDPCCAHSSSASTSATRRATRCGVRFLYFSLPRDSRSRSIGSRRPGSRWRGFPHRLYATACTTFSARPVPESTTGLAWLSFLVNGSRRADPSARARCRPLRLPDADLSCRSPARSTTISSRRRTTCRSAPRSRQSSVVTASASRSGRPASRTKRACQRAAADWGSLVRAHTRAFRTTPAQVPASRVAALGENLQVDLSFRAAGARPDVYAHRVRTATEPLSVEPPAPLAATLSGATAFLRPCRAAGGLPRQRLVEHALAAQCRVWGSGSKSSSRPGGRSRPTNFSCSSSVASTRTLLLSMRQRTLTSRKSRRMSSRRPWSTSTGNSSSLVSSSRFVTMSLLACEVRWLGG